jgi:hypothetical protein
MVVIDVPVPSSIWRGLLNSAARTAIILGCKNLVESRECEAVSPPQLNLKFIVVTPVDQLANFSVGICGAADEA